MSDANGNTLTGGGKVNTWDSQNRLVKVVKGGVTSEFTYGSDGLCRRRSLVTNAVNETTQTDYVYDGSMLVSEVVKHYNSGQVRVGLTDNVTYLQGPSGPLYRKSSLQADPKWYVYDGLGSVVGEVDVLGNLSATKTHDVYGLTRGVTGSPTSRQGFVGSLGHISDDETGLVYMRARYYDPSVGRFENEDSAHDGRNWFAYCGNDPINHVDPSGKMALDILTSSLDECVEKIEEIANATAIKGRVFALVLYIDTRMAAMGAMLEGLGRDSRGGQLVLRYYSSLSGAAQTFRFDVKAGAIDLKGPMSNQFNTTGIGHAWPFAKAIQEAVDFLN